MSGNKRYLCGCLASGSGGDPLPGYCPDHPILFRGQSLRAQAEGIVKNYRPEERAHQFARAYLALLDENEALAKALKLAEAEIQEHSREYHHATPMATFHQIRAALAEYHLRVCKIEHDKDCDECDVALAALAEYAKRKQEGD